MSFPIFLFLISSTETSLHLPQEVVVLRVSLQIWTMVSLPQSHSHKISLWDFGKIFIGFFTLNFPNFILESSSAIISLHLPQDNTFPEKTVFASWNVLLPHLHINQIFSLDPNFISLAVSIVNLP